MLIGQSRHKPRNTRKRTVRVKFMALIDKSVALSPLSVEARDGLGTRKPIPGSPAWKSDWHRILSCGCIVTGLGFAVQVTAQRLVEVNKAAVQVEVEVFHPARRNRRGVVAYGGVDALALVGLWHGQPEKVGDARRSAPMSAVEAPGCA